MLLEAKSKLDIELRAEKSLEKPLSAFKGDIHLLGKKSTSLSRSNVFFGRLYNWFALSGLAPSGWSVPTWLVYDDLEWWASRVSVPGHLPLNKLNSANVLDLNNINSVPGFVSEIHIGNNVMGFNGLGTGVRLNGRHNINIAGYYHTTTQLNYIGIGYQQPTFSIFYSGGSYAAPQSGMAVRLVRSTTAGWKPGDILEDIDGNVYDIIRVGDYLWTAQNWASTRLANGTEITHIPNNVANDAAWDTTTSAAYCNPSNSEWMVKRL